MFLFVVFYIDKLNSIQFFIQTDKHILEHPQTFSKTGACQAITNYTIILGNPFDHLKNWYNAQTVIRTSIPDIGRVYQPPILAAIKLDTQFTQAIVVQNHVYVMMLAMPFGRILQW